MEDSISNSFETCHGLRRVKCIIQRTKPLLNQKKHSLDPRYFRDLFGYNLQALEIARGLNEPLWISKALKSVGSVAFFFDQHRDTIRYLQEYFDFSEPRNLLSDSPGSTGYTHYMLAVSCLVQSEYQRALEHYLSALRLTEGTKYHTTHVIALQGVGFVNRYLGQHEKSMEYFQRSLEECQEHGLVTHSISSYNEIGNLLHLMKKLDEALVYQRQALELARKNGLSRFCSYILHDMGLVYQTRNEPEAALKLLYDDYYLNGQNMLPRDRCITLTNLSIMLFDSGETEEALKLINEAIQLCEENSYISEMEGACSALAGMQEQLGNYPEAFKAMKKTYQTNRKVFNEKLSEHTAEMQLRFDTERKEQEARVYRLKNIELAEANRTIRESLEELKRMQQEKLELEKRNTALAMAVTANHEINQPLMVLRGHLEMLQDKLENAFSIENLDRHLNAMNRSITSIEKILARYRNPETITVTEYSSETPMLVFDKDD